jgi:hypothetical protein
MIKDGNLKKIKLSLRKKNKSIRQNRHINFKKLKQKLLEDIKNEME